MNPSQLKSKSLSSATELLCVASAILVAGYFLECAGFSNGTSRCQAQYYQAQYYQAQYYQTQYYQTQYYQTQYAADPSALDYAHSVPFKQASASHPERPRSSPASRISDASTHPWYRYALPISTAVFLLTFGLWSLQSQANHAISELNNSKQESKQESTNQSIANECCGTLPTSACQHAIEEQALPQTG